MVSGVGTAPEVRGPYPSKVDLARAKLTSDSPRSIQSGARLILDLASQPLQDGRPALQDRERAEFFRLLTRARMDFVRNPPKTGLPKRAAKLVKDAIETFGGFDRRKAARDLLTPDRRTVLLVNAPLLGHDARKAIEISELLRGGTVANMGTDAAVETVSKGDAPAVVVFGFPPNIPEAAVVGLEKLVTALDSVGAGNRVLVLARTAAEKPAIDSALEKRGLDRFDMLVLGENVDYIARSLDRNAYL